MTNLPDLEPAAPDVPADIVKAAEVAADMVGVTPYSDMRVHVEYAARYALLADRAARSTVPEAGKAVDVQLRAAWEAGRKSYCPTGILKDAERTEREWQRAKSTLASVPAPSGADDNSGMVTDHLLSDPGHVSDSPAVRESGESTAPIPADVARLVMAARIVAFESQDAEALRELDKASEAFADRVPWDDEPRIRAPQAVLAEDVAAALAEVDELERYGNATSRHIRAALTSLSAERDKARRDLDTWRARGEAYDAEAADLRRKLEEAYEQMDAIYEECASVAVPARDTAFEAVEAYRSTIRLLHARAADRTRRTLSGAPE